MFSVFMPKILTDRLVLDQCSQYIYDHLYKTVISGLSSDDFDVLKKILGFSTAGFYLDLTEKRAIHTFDFRLKFFIHRVYKYVFCLITKKSVAPLIWSIPFDSTTSVGFTIAFQSGKRATSGAVGTKRLSLSGNQ